MGLFLVLNLNLFASANPTRMVDFSSDVVPVCGQRVSWGAILKGATDKELACLDAQSPIQLSEPEMGSGYGPGDDVVRREELVDWLKQTRKECLSEVEFTIPVKVRLQRRRALTQEVLMPWIQSALSSEYPGSIIEVVSVHSPKLECHSIEFMTVGSLRVEGRNTFRALLVADEKNFGVTGEFKVYQNVPVALRNLAVNEKIQDRDLQWKKREVTHSMNFLKTKEELIGQVVVYPVPQGEYFQPRSVKPENLIEKGQLVQVRFQGENFDVTASAVAEQSGILGDIVRIKNTESQKVLSGVVTGKGTVEVR